MKWDEACDASVNGKAKRDEGEETWLIIDRDGIQISYKLSDGKRTEITGPIARRLVLDEDDDGKPFFRTIATIDVTIIEKFDDWRPSVPKLVVEEVTSLDELEDDISDEAVDELIDMDTILVDELNSTDE